MNKLKRRGKLVPKRWHVISRFIEENGWTHGAELGVHQGLTLRYLVARHRDLHMTAVDIWEPIPEKDKLYAIGGRSYLDFDLPGAFEMLKAYLDRDGFSDRVEFLKMATHAAASRVPDQSLDFVFIDADHLEEAVRRDIRDWAPKVRPGGALMGHDAADREKFPGVDNALNDLLPGWTLHEDHVWHIPIDQVKLPDLRASVPPQKSSERKTEL